MYGERLLVTGDSFIRLIQIEIPRTRALEAGAPWDLAIADPW